MSVLAKIGLTADAANQFWARSLKGKTGRRGLPENVVAAMHRDYQRLGSLSKVARVWQRTRQAVYDIFKTNGLPLNKRKFHPTIVWQDRRFTPGKSGYYRETTGDRTPLHHLVYESSTGRKIPAGWQVGFKDADPLNVASDNLFCAPTAEVTFFHQSKVHPNITLPLPDKLLFKKKRAREHAAKRASKFVAQGLRTDGKPRSVKPITPKESKPGKRVSNVRNAYDEMKASLGLISPHIEDSIV